MPLSPVHPNVQITPVDSIKVTYNCPLRCKLNNAFMFLEQLYYCLNITYYERDQRPTLKIEFAQILQTQHVPKAGTVNKWIYVAYHI